MKSNTKTVPSKETTPSKGLSDVKIPNKPKSDQCEPKVCTDARKISAPTRDVAVDIRCPICTCATQCHGTRCYRSTEIINPNLNVVDASNNMHELAGSPGEIPRPHKTDVKWKQFRASGFDGGNA
ncbi:hypothetical protein RR48_03292 [Papilio machaon]|uniref:Uncharacterized protein n=1 Tax=Papilio machaon TaxID=76193 RepID=A0A0N1PGN9_PAPMA|nr:hypothetical protein RR48_03292 [Papilio machaon]